MPAARKLLPRNCFASLRKDAAGKFAKAGIECGELDARVLLAHAAGMSASELVAKLDQEADEIVTGRFNVFVARRLKGEPVARIVGRKEFWSHEFLLGPDTLVPRPESETIVEAALEAKPEKSALLRVLDLGTGTGILLAALLLERPNAWGVSIDRNVNALRVARGNFQRLALADRAFVMCGDWCAAVGRKFDLVVSNPPYVETRIIASLKPEVRDHDPALALDGGMDGLDAYRAICAELPMLLAPEGVAVLELGMGQEAAVSGIARSAGLTVNDVKTDLAGCPRALVMGLEPDKKPLGSIREPH